MKVTHAEFIISAATEKQYPTDRLPEIALAGRSNVGKSSFINTLISRRNLARTSSKPGKTQTLNYYRINEQFYFVDVPGYGYAKVSKKEREKWALMMETYFQKRKHLKAVLLVIDLRHEPTKDDVQMYDYLIYYDWPVIVVATKLDKVPKGKRASFIKRAKDTLDLKDTDHIVPFSAYTGEGKRESWQLLKAFISR
ncbi:MAG TPA: ribosome biogenesis GTP-binding protein YihA/YsxC [Cerasibacillus sp.]|uniref:ribosome biogenesis GTP-binding protein YihA/YsxC n=1 Tax=Cerasibacillus sp. TaxID=2498711 RepID=UPI002F41C576